LTPKPFYFDNGPKAVVLLHSFSGTSTDMRLLGRFLERHYLKSQDLSHVIRLTHSLVATQRGERASKLCAFIK